MFGKHFICFRFVYLDGPCHLKLKVIVEIIDFVCCNSVILELQSVRKKQEAVVRTQHLLLKVE